jgi:hypothetical protein
MKRFHQVAIDERAQRITFLVMDTTERGRMKRVSEERLSELEQWVTMPPNTPDHGNDICFERGDPKGMAVLEDLRQVIAEVRRHRAGRAGKGVRGRRD